ncbi:hypothetical protein IC757_01355 [Wenzhouxiangella sp. AB-CW3]|uniref:sensor histidine kinase n=1 Tax=Wenzhouxiangella sp. AB-CW3 TaxID=2771012 RepID=UPI00168A9ECF|nr:hybrid sensor histidine kinase/response regulator [Wenzhouxiangella sp. AB-CW3]QOC22842.1 hypothetical protein IC757_01355 [Wenzhouxiangella sp. AB-CW3]
MRYQPAILTWWLAMLLLILATASTAAHDLGPVVRSISVSDGLPDSMVEAVIQDAHGYVWIGTQSGLVRHEGDRLNILGADPDSDDPLPGRNIMTLAAHSDGTVWAAVSGQGVVQIGPDLLQKRHLAPKARGGSLPDSNVWSMVEDCQGDMWMALMQGGVVRFRPDTGELQHFPQTEESGLHPDGFQVSLDRGDDCRIWLAQTEQVNVITPGEEDRFRKVAPSSEGGTILTVRVLDGEVYYNDRSRLYRIRESHDEPEKVLRAAGVITDFTLAPDDADILVSSYAGLYRLPRNGATPSLISAIQGLNDGLPSSTLMSVMVDREGGTWMGIPRHGVAYLAPGHEAFRRYQSVPGRESALDLDVVFALTELPEANRLWMGGRSRESMRVLDLNTGSVQSLGEYLDNPELEEMAAPVADLHVEQDTMLATSLQFVDRIHADGTSERLIDRETVDGGTPSFALPDGEAHVWVGTIDVGLIRLNTETGEREHFWGEGEGRYHWPEGRPVALESGPDGQWWALAGGGIYRLEEDGFVRQVEPSRPPFLAGGWHGEELWAATETHLKRWRRNGHALEQTDRFEMAGHLRPGRVLRILRQEDDSIWLARSSGLVHLDPDTGHFREFTRADGLAVSELRRRAITWLADGRLVLGGTGGLVVVDTDLVGGTRVEPPIYVRGVSVGGRFHALSPDREQRERIMLSHNENSFYVDYTALSYLSFDQNRYRVRLEGWDDKWLELVGQTRFHYSNLPPGDYRFQVRAAAADGHWNETGDAVELSIRQPPWLSGWALSAYAILGLTGVGAGWKSYSNARRRRREMREVRQKRVQAEEQRQVIERLNRNLDPQRLATTIGEEMLEVTGGRVAWVGLTQEHLPRQVIPVGQADEGISREEWRSRLNAADGETSMAVSLESEGEVLGQVLIGAGAAGFVPAGIERVNLLREMCGQALRNAALLEQVRALAVSAEQASAAKSEFLATMSHEIRTPLHGVLGMVELLYESENDPAQQGILNTLRQSGLQLQRIIDDVLDISRIEAGRLSLHPQPFELTAMLEQVIDLHAPNAARKGLDLRLRMASTLPIMAIGDADRISQVLGNLLSNAVKFTNFGGIELNAELDAKGMLRLTVSDSGSGISARDRDRLFEPFTQLDASITRSHSGSGLGLAICRRLVNAMDGQLELLDSCYPGSRFMVRLPLFPQSLGKPALPRTRLLEGMAIAVLAEAPTRRVLHRLCRRWGVQLINATTSEPRLCSILLVDARCSQVLTDPEEWCEYATRIAWLQSPYLRSSPEEARLPEEAHFLRWPLVESRLIGMLLDLAIAGGRKR